MRGFAIGSVVVGLSLLLAGAGRGDDNADAKPILDKAVKAMGGEDKLAKLKTGTAKGKITVPEGGQTITAMLDVSCQDLDKYHADVAVEHNGMNVNILMVINGGNAWSKNDNQTQELPKEVVSFVRDLLYALRAPHVLPLLRGKDFKLSPLGELKIDDKTAVGLLVAHKDHKDISLYFDKQTGLPLKSEVRLKDPQGKEVPIEFLYSDYKDFNGVKQPGKITIKADNKELTAELNDIKGEDKLDASLFSKP